MTTDRPMGIEVTQADRDAATAMWLAAHGDAATEWQAEWMKEGYADEGPVVQAFARHRQSSIASLTESVGIVVVERIETVAGDFGTEPGEPFWRVRIGEQCADFDFELAARNFASAIHGAAALTLSALSGDAGEGESSDPDLDRHIFAWFNDRYCDEMRACLEAYSAHQGTGKP